MTTDKFDNVGNDEDTTILLSIPTSFGDYDVLYQKWVWDGITAESLIFLNKDLEGIEIFELEKEIINSALFDSSSQLTTSSKSEYTFFNFNFTTND